jgi:hypothetical protein
MNEVAIVLAVAAGLSVTGWALYMMLRIRRRSTQTQSAHPSAPAYMPHSASSEYYRPGDRKPPDDAPAPKEAPGTMKDKSDPRKAPLPRCPVCDAAIGYAQERCPRCGHVLRPF